MLFYWFDYWLKYVFSWTGYIWMYMWNFKLIKLYNRYINQVLFSFFVNNKDNFKFENIICQGNFSIQVIELNNSF